MNVVVISRSSALSAALQSQFASRSRASIALPLDDVHALGVDQLRGAMVVDADALVSLQCKDSCDATELQRLLALRQDFKARCDALAVPYLLLSDGRLFGAAAEEVEYAEGDELAPSDVAGFQLAELEQLLCAAGEQGMVLRTGPLIAVQGDNFLGDCLATMRGGKVLRLNDTRMACPTPVADLARVISGLVDQISCGTPCRGVYHYASSGAASAYEFAEVACAFASQFVAPIADIEVDDGGEGWRPAVPVLSCDRILQDFGIKRLPWRAYLPRMIKSVCEEAAK